MFSKDLIIKLDEKSELIYFPEFLNAEDSDYYFNKLSSELNWKSEKIKIFGKVYDQPRLLCWYGDKSAIYSYSGITQIPNPWTDELLELKKNVEKISCVEFNSVLANKYRNGDDSMGWHSDDEKELGPEPVIASLTLGAKRKFSFRPRKNIAGSTKHLYLESGSLLIMNGFTQQNWQHSLAKTKKDCGERINLTFRKINY
jgi:alkylated DNA repair dioxygenase AlkB